MKIRIEDLHLLGFYFLIKLEQDFEYDPTNNFMTKETHVIFIKSYSGLIVGMIQEAEKVLTENNLISK